MKTYLLVTCSLLCIILSFYAVTFPNHLFPIFSILFPFPTQNNHSSAPIFPKAKFTKKVLQSLCFTLKFLCTFSRSKRSYSKTSPLVLLNPNPSTSSGLSSIIFSNLHFQTLSPSWHLSLYLEIYLGFLQFKSTPSFPSHLHYLLSKVMRLYC